MGWIRPIKIHLVLGDRTGLISNVPCTLNTLSEGSIPGRALSMLPFRLFFQYLKTRRRYTLNKKKDRYCVDAAFDSVRELYQTFLHPVIVKSLITLVKVTVHSLHLSRGGWNWMKEFACECGTHRYHQQSNSCLPDIHYWFMAENVWIILACK